MTDIDGLLAANAKPTPPEQHPKGWAPGVAWSSAGGEIVTKAPPGIEIDDAFWKLVISDWGLDPQVTEIVPDSVEIRVWDMPVGKGETIRARYYKAKIRPRRAAMTDGERVDLVALAMRSRTRKTLTPKPGPAVAFVVNLSDFQIGKGEV